MAALVALVALMVPMVADRGVPAASATMVSVDLRVLVISADGTETDHAALTSSLDRLGVPHDVLIARDHPMSGAGLAAMLSDGAGHGRYQGIMLTTGDLTYESAGVWQSAFSTEQWDALHAYQAEFGVRSVTSFTFADGAYGFDYVGSQNTLTHPVDARLTPAGAAVFPYVNSADPIRLSGAYLYFGSVLDGGATTPLLTAAGPGGASYPVASVTRFPDGRENLAVTVANNATLTHSLVLSYGLVDWVTRGRFVGERRASLGIQVDDLFNQSDVWDASTHALSPTALRNTPADIAALIAWQDARHALPSTPDVRTSFAFNAGDTLPGEVSDPSLIAAVQAGAPNFRFINHTLTHYNLDCGDCAEPTGVITTSASEITRQITANIAQGQALGLQFDADTMVQPDISGINTPPNAVAQQAAADAGIRYWIGDTSRPGLGNPSFNTGFATAGDQRLHVVPRHPTNLFYQVSTPEQWVDLYNTFYGPGGTICTLTSSCFDTPRTFAQILDVESDYLLGYLLSGDNDPLMFHIANVHAYDGTHSLMTDLLDATLAKYDALVTLPIASPSFRETGVEQQERAAFDASGVTATYTPCVGTTVRVVTAATVPLTGVSLAAGNSRVEHYGGKVISHITLGDGESVTIPDPTCAPATTTTGATTTTEGTTTVPTTVPTTATATSTVPAGAEPPVRPSEAAVDARPTQPVAPVESASPVTAPATLDPNLEAFYRFMDAYLNRLRAMIDHFNRQCLRPNVRVVMGVRCSPGLIRLQKAIMADTKAKATARARAARARR